jgi:hypothetical protein
MQTREQAHKIQLLLFHDRQYGGETSWRMDHIGIGEENQIARR